MLIKQELVCFNILIGSIPDFSYIVSGGKLQCIYVIDFFVVLFLDTTIQDVPLVGGMVPYSFIQLENLLKEEAARRDKFPVIKFVEFFTLLFYFSNDVMLNIFLF